MRHGTPPHRRWPFNPPPLVSRFVTRADRRCGQMHANNGRDHKAVLELPANLDEIPKEKQCDWIKKQYKKLAKKCATT